VEVETLSGTFLKVCMYYSQGGREEDPGGKSELSEVQCFASWLFMCKVEMAEISIVAMLSDFNFAHGQPTCKALCIGERVGGGGRFEVPSYELGPLSGCLYTRSLVLIHAAWMFAIYWSPLPPLSNDVFEARPTTSKSTLYPTSTYAKMAAHKGDPRFMVSE
jgi:hypothetical protein